MIVDRPWDQASILFQATTGAEVAQRNIKRVNAHCRTKQINHAERPTCQSSHPGIFKNTVEIFFKGKLAEVDCRCVSNEWFCHGLHRERGLASVQGMPRWWQVQRWLFPLEMISPCCTATNKPCREVHCAETSVLCKPFLLASPYAGKRHVAPANKKAKFRHADRQGAEATKKSTGTV